MSTLKVLLFILLMASEALTKREASEPNCTEVKDFKPCMGNTDNFCPDTIPCQCKDEKPFCRCDYYRVDWKEYWYMGPKCNHLWNTLDFILVATLPAVGLLIILVGIFCCVSHCKSKKARAQAMPPYHGAQHNPAFTPENGLGHVYQPGRENADWIGQIPKPVLRREDFDDAPSPSQLQNYRRSDPAADYLSNQPPRYEQFGSPRDDLPYGAYTERRQHQKY